MSQRPVKQKMLPGCKRLPVRMNTRFQAAFSTAINVTKSYTLSRDVQDIVEDALRREKRIP